MPNSYEDIYIKINSRRNKAYDFEFFVCNSSGEILEKQILHSYDQAFSLLEQIKEKKKKRLSLIVPTESLIFHNVVVQINQLRHINSIIPALLEENIVGEIEEYDFKIINKNLKNSQVEILVFLKKDYEMWSSLLANQNATNCKIIPDILLLPYTQDSVNFLFDNDRIICRTQALQGFSFQKEYLEVFLELLEKDINSSSANRMNYQLYYFDNLTDESYHFAGKLINNKKINHSDLFRYLRLKSNTKIIKQLNIFGDYKGSGFLSGLKKYKTFLPLLIISLVMIETSVRLFYGFYLDSESEKIEEKIEERISPYISSSYSEELIKNIISRAANNKLDNQDKFSILLAKIIQEITNIEEIEFEQISFNSDNEEIFLIYKINDLSTLDKIKSTFEESSFEASFSVSKDGFSNMLNVKMKIMN